MKRASAERHRSERKAAGRRYYQENKKRILAKNAEWARKNPEKRKMIEQKWVAANSDAVKMFRRAWFANNPDKSRAFCAKRRARIRAVGGSHGAGDIVWLKGIQKLRCAHSWCGKSLKRGYHVDHIIPLALGGTNDKRNLQLLCQPCNNSKCAIHPIEFARRRGMLL